MIWYKQKNLFALKSTILDGTKTRGGRSSIFLPTLITWSQNPPEVDEARQ